MATARHSGISESVLIAGMLGGFALLWVGLFGAALVYANVPDRTSGTLFALFMPGTPAEDAFATIVAAGGSPVRDTDYGIIWVAHSGESGFAGALRRPGALAVYETLPFGPPPLGCLGLLTADSNALAPLVR